MEMTDTLLIASQNIHKIAEITPMLEAAGYTVTDARHHELPEPVEDGGSFIANARIKAQACMEATGMAVLADDSGLVITELAEGDTEFPGVESAPYAQELGGYPQAVADIFKRLNGKPADCAYVCVLLLLFPDGTEIIAEGRVEGTLIPDPRGDGTFGFDPWFQIKGSETTFAEISTEEKNRISHRGLALRELQHLLKHTHELRILS